MNYPTLPIVLITLISALASLPTHASQDTNLPCIGNDFAKSTTTIRSLYLDYISGSYLSIYEDHDYVLIVEKARHDHANGKINFDTLGWVAEAYYALAEIKSGNKDPQPYPGMDYRYDGRSNMNPVKHDLYLIHTEVGPNLWSKQAKEQYGELILCLAAAHRSKIPKHPGYFARRLAALISYNDFERAFQEMQALEKNELELESTVGEYLAIFTERFVGYGKPVEAAKWLATVRSRFGLKQETVSYWKKLLGFAVDEFSNLDKAVKTNKKNRIDAILS